MKIGLVGVGKWGMTLARKFKDLGHEIAYYDRLQSNTPVEDLGNRMSWMQMGKFVDAMVIAAIQPVASEIALVNAMLGVPLLVTKPLFHAEETVIKRVPAPFAVDYVHLHSPIMKSLYDITDSKKKNAYITKVTSEFWGRGPIRSGMTSLFDYGPHAISTLLELTGSAGINITEAKMKPTGDRELWTASGSTDDVEISLTTGNGAEDERCRLDVLFSDGTTARYDEQFPTAYLEVNGKKIEQTIAHDPLGELLQEFVDHVRTKDSVMTEAAAQSDLAMSVDVMDTINKIRRAAD